MSYSGADKTRKWVKIVADQDFKDKINRKY